MPGFVGRDLWPDLAAHAGEHIDFEALRGKRLAVIGGGASAWDNAATALERGAASAQMFVRRATLPHTARLPKLYGRPAPTTICADVNPDFSLPSPKADISHSSLLRKV